MVQAQLCEEIALPLAIPVQFLLPCESWRLRTFQHYIGSLVTRVGNWEGGSQSWMSILAIRAACFHHTNPITSKAQPKIAARIAGTAWAQGTCLLLALLQGKPLPGPFPSTSPEHHKTFETEKCHSGDLSQSPTDLTLVSQPCPGFTVMEQPWLPSLSLSLLHSRGAAAMGLGHFCCLGPVSSQITGFQSHAALLHLWASQS